jgi:hypothetical protein
MVILFVKEGCPPNPSAELPVIDATFTDLGTIDLSQDCAAD